MQFRDAFRVGRFLGAFSAVWLLVTTIGALSHAAEPTKPLNLRAGPLSMIFDAENAFLRYIKIGKHEILRGINAPIRDRNWGTVMPEVSNLRVDDRGDHFSVEFDALCKQNDVDFHWQGKIIGSRDGEVRFTFDGEARSTFMRNRIGMCVLHPAEVAGKPWIIRQVNGEESRGQFPTHISPHQPAKQIRGVSHQVADKVWAHVEMQGDVFEMEDQRNWTDASFKTYCTPLELPYPVEVKSSTRIKHEVRVRVDGDVASVKTDETQRSDEPIVLTLGERTATLPRIGLQVSSDAKELSSQQLARLKELRLDHLRVDLQLSSSGFVAKLRETSRQSQTLGVPLHVGIHLNESSAAELPKLVDELKELAPKVAVFIVHITDWRQFEPARTALLPVRGNALIGAVRGDNFVDLNRDRPAGDGIDVVAFPINPQIHAFDDMSLVETLSIQGDAVRSAQSFLGKRQLAVGPVTLRPPLAKPSSAAAAQSAEPASDTLPADVDVRQSRDFTAAWTLGSLKYLAEAGAPSVTYFETVGRKGIMGLESGAGQAAPKGASGEKVSTFPVYPVLRELADFAGGEVRQVDSSDELAAVALALQKQRESRVLVANLTGRQRSIVVKGLQSPRNVALLHVAKDTDVPAADIVSDEAGKDLVLNLPPQAIVRIKVSKD
jgi:hypothetical protein